MMLIFKKRGRLNKKAILSDVLFFMIDLILTLVVFYLLAKYIDNVTENTIFEKNYLSRDIALLTDTIYAAPGNILLDYPENTLWFSYEFTENNLAVTEGLLASASYPFMEDKNINFQHKTITPKKKYEEKESFIDKYLPVVSMFYPSKYTLPEGTSVKIRFKKRANELFIDYKDKIDPDITKLLCPDVDTSEPLTGKKVLIGPIQNKEDVENEEIKAKVKGADIAVIVLYGNNADKEVNNVNAYISIDSKILKKNKKLACLILNYILESDDLNSIIKENNLDKIKNVNIIPTDEFSLLPPHNLVVLLEMGNKQIDREKNILANDDAIKAIINTINKAIEDYFIK